MKTFYTYINEKEKKLTVEDEVGLIQKNCKPFLKEVGNNLVDNPLYRGVSKKIVSLTRQTVRTDRKPKDIKLEIHNMLDKMFNKKFGIKARSKCLFVTPSADDAGNFGELHLVFPISKFNYIWSSNIEDLWTRIYQVDKYRLDDKKLTGDPEKDKKYLQNIVDGYQKNKGLTKNEFSEVMIQCKFYYMKYVKNKFEAKKILQEYSQYL